MIEQFYDEKTGKAFIKLEELKLTDSRCAGCWFDNTDEYRDCNHITECDNEEFILVDPDDKDNIARYVAAKLE